MPGEDARRCARCGLEFGDGPNQCGDFTGSPAGLEGRVACRNREISNLHTMLRGVTRRLENARQAIDDVLESIS